MSATQRLTRSNTLSKEDYLQSQVFLSKEQLAVQAFHGSGLLRYKKEEDEISDDEDLDLAPHPGWGKVIGRDLGLYSGHLSLGMTTALLGVTLLEIQTQTGADIDKISFLLTWCFAGCLISTLIAGAVFDRLHPKFQFGLAQIMMAVVMVAIPWVTNYYAVSFLVFLQGMGHGYLVTTVAAQIFSMWGARTGPFLQTLHFTYSVGCMLAPVMSKPFLTVESTNTSSVEELTGETLLNSSLILSDQGMEQAVAINNYINNVSSTSRIVHEGTFYPFLIIGLCQVPPAIYCFVQFAMDKCRLIRTPKGPVGSTEQGSKPNIVMLILFLIMLFFPCGLESSFSGLFYTYIVKHLEWPVDSANLLLMTFWVMFAGGRFLTIPLVKILKPDILLTMNLSITMVALILMATASHITVFVWLSTVMVGFTIGPLVPNSMLYAGTFMTISGKVAASLTASLFTSAMVMPICLGLLFKHVGMEWFVYIDILATGVISLAFIVIRIVGAKCYPATSSNDEPQEKDIKRLEENL